ncbi:hypothetical protein [Neolewinella agarilytica]|uniref:Uncharacterized protein n=1 Tax=Neolewinella agarilytica TaxID=478744 RepID=A0A1H9KH84_9BACT|nr:hypothetical protein [Neolewinella agarilytica]SEQ98193.1 hypothetical protein SAMN05444359_12099 [Neolewinella agarilytica]
MLYKESQKFNHWWLWLLNLSIFAGLLYIAYRDWNAVPTMELLIGPLVIALVMILLATLELRTAISKDGLEVKFWPLGRKRIFKSEIKRAFVRKYSPLGEFGGWGYRVGSAGKAFNMYGSQGLQLEMQNGDRLLIGTQRPEELAEFIKDWLEPEDELTDEMVSLKLKELNENSLES